MSGNETLLACKKELVIEKVDAPIPYSKIPKNEKVDALIPDTETQKNTRQSTWRPIPKGKGCPDSILFNYFLKINHKGFGGG